MKSQKMTIIAVVACCVAVFAVLLLVLSITGVISIGGQNMEPYDYLCENGMFRTSYEISGIGTEYTHYEWESTDGIYKLTRNDFYHDWGTGVYYSFTSRNCWGTASISDTAVNTSDSSKKAYDEFFEWCESLGYNSNEILAALDQYADSRK